MFALVVQIAQTSGRCVEPEADECLEPRMAPEKGWLYVERALGSDLKSRGTLNIDVPMI